MAGRLRLVGTLFVIAVGPAAFLLALGAVEGVAETMFVMLVTAVVFFVGVLSQLQAAPER